MTPRSPRTASSIKLNGSWEMGDLPSVNHKVGSNISFADGHTETHHWKDPRTPAATHDSIPMPGSADVLWIAQHSTWRDH